ncbi:hypothetical protein A2U20_11670 (plasmid) [Glaesserella parasuis D74]|nr:hypothetical protein A2U20_11670 [Glaesserella parasuis D74]
MGVFRLFFIKNCDKDHKISSFLLCDRCFSSKTGFGNFSILKPPLTKQEDSIMENAIELFVSRKNEEHYDFNNVAW